MKISPIALELAGRVPSVIMGGGGGGGGGGVGWGGVGWGGETNHKRRAI